VVEPGRLIAQGRSADVYECGAGRVLRRYRIEHESAEYEARVMQHVRALGFPAPEVFDAAGPDLVMERVDGLTMLEALGKRPWTLASLADTLADLHQRLHALPAPDWVPPELGGGPALVHLDLHPLNVLMTPGGPVVIDWPNTRRAEAATDVAHSWIVLASASPERRYERVLAAAGRGLFLRRFLGHFDRASLVDVMPAVAARWLSDRNVADRERQVTYRFLRGLGVSAETG